MKEYERWTEWVCKCGNSMKHRCTSGAQRTWVGLTDEEFRAILRSLSRQQGWDGDGWDLALKEAIEAKLKEKNT